MPMVEPGRSPSEARARGLANLQLYDSTRILLLRKAGGLVILWSSFQLACAFGAGETAGRVNTLVSLRSGRFEGRMHSTRCKEKLVVREKGIVKWFNAAKGYGFIQ